MSALVLLVLLCCQAPWAEAGDRLRIAGQVCNVHGQGIKEVTVEVRYQGEPLRPAGRAKGLRTGADGSFAGEFLFPGAVTAGGEVEVRAHKPAWRPSGPVLVKLLPGGVDPGGHRLFLAQPRLLLERQITPAFWLATCILLLVYLLIALEWLHRTLAALAGATLVLLISYTLGTFSEAFFILSFEDAMHAIDLNVIFLLLGMMLMVGVLKKTGVFQWLACQSFVLARGRAWILAIFLMVITALISAFLDNVTTMLLIIPVTIEIALTLRISPLAFLIPEVFASNVGGTATLIGDPPNILIGSYANLTFSQFVHNLSFLCLLCLGVSTGFFLFWYRKEYFPGRIRDLSRTLRELKDSYRLTNPRLAALALIFLGITIVLFLVHGLLDMEPSVAALTGAMLLLIFSGVDIVELLEHEVEWPTLIFFMALFVVIAGAEETGLIQFLAEGLRRLCGDSLPLAVILVLWGSALASAFIDNIPFTATMLPIIAYLNESLPGTGSGVLWWALALGACLGGNGTLIGASANVVTAGLAERAGYPISFLEYLKICFAPMLLTVGLAMVYLLLAY